MALQVQTGTVLSLADKLFKINDTSIVTSALTSLDTKLPAFAGRDIIGEAVSVENIEPNRHGWCVQAWVDLGVLRLCGDAMSLARGGAGLGRIPRERRLVMAAMAESSTKISPRLRSHLRGVNGSAVQHAKGAWNVFKQVQEELQSASKCHLSLGIVQKFRDDCNNAIAADSWVVVYNVLADMYNNSPALTAIKCFDSVYTGGDSSSDDAESARLAEEVSAAYVSCIEIIIKGNSNYADIIQCAAFGEGSLDKLPSRRELPRGSQHGDDTEDRGARPTEVL